MEPLHKIAARAIAAHRSEAEQAFALLRTWTNDLPRVPGMDTVLRLAIRIDCGKSVQEAAAKEYVYRWSLAIQSRVFGAPHVWGL